MAEWEIVKGVVQSSANTEPEKWTAFEGCRSIAAYTDGSAPIRNPGGPAGFAAVLVGFPDSNEAGAETHEDTTPYAMLELSGYVPQRTQEPATSNNRAEIAGVLAALESLRRLGEMASTVWEVVIWSDSSYVVNCANGTWQRKKNTDLWPILDHLAEEVRRWAANGLTIRWQRGHAGHRYNEAADELATRAAFNFDDATYKRYRTAQAVTGREMPGTKALGQHDPGSKPAEAQKPRTEREPKAIEPEDWLTGSDYTVVLYTRMDEANARHGASTGHYCLFAKDGRYRHTRVDHDGEHGPNEAEYLTLIAVLNHIRERIAAAGRDMNNYSLTIYSHNELVVKQLRGEYKVKAPALQYHYVEARALLGSFKNAELMWRHSREIGKLFPG